MAFENEPDILTVKDISRITRLSTRRIYELTSINPEYGGIKTIKIGSSKRVFKVDLEEWLQDQKKKWEQR